MNKYTAPPMGICTLLAPCHKECPDDKILGIYRRPLVVWSWRVTFWENQLSGSAESYVTSVPECLHYLRWLFKASEDQYQP